MKKSLFSQILKSDLPLKQKADFYELAHLLKIKNYPEAFFMARKLQESMVQEAVNAGEGWFSQVSTIPYLLDGLAYVVNASASEYLELGKLFTALADQLVNFKEQNREISTVYATILVFAGRFYTKANEAELAKELQSKTLSTFEKIYTNKMFMARLNLEYSMLCNALLREGEEDSLAFAEHTYYTAKAALRHHKSLNLRCFGQMFQAASHVIHSWKGRLTFREWFKWHRRLLVAELGMLLEVINENDPFLFKAFSQC